MTDGYKIDREAVAQWHRENDALANTPYNVIDPRTNWNGSDRWRIVKQADVNAKLWSPELTDTDIPYLAEADSREAAEALLLRMSIETLES
jgi:hypothetical protein